MEKARQLLTLGKQNGQERKSRRSTWLGLNNVYLDKQCNNNTDPTKE